MLMVLSCQHVKPTNGKTFSAHSQSASLSLTTKAFSFLEATLSPPQTPLVWASATTGTLDNFDRVTMAFYGVWKTSNLTFFRYLKDIFSRLADTKF